METRLTAAPELASRPPVAILDPVRPGQLDELLARAREVPDPGLPPGFSAAVTDRAGRRRGPSRKTLLAWCLALAVLAGGTAYALWSVRSSAEALSAPPLPLFEGRDFPFLAP